VQNRDMSRKLTHEQAAKIMRAANLEPLDQYPGNKDKWKCKCLKCEQIVFPRFGSVSRGQGGCRDCGMKRGTSSRRSDEKEVVEMLKKAGAIPLEPYKSNSSPWKSMCLKCKREISPRLGNIKKGSAACAYCAGKKVHPDDALNLMKSVGLEPLEPYPGSNKKWKCRHKKCGDIVFPMHSWIVAGQGGCQKCGYIESGLKGRVSEDFAVQVMEKSGLTPLEPYKGAGKPWKSKCIKCGQISSPTFGSIQSGSGCGVCAGKIVVPKLAVELMLQADLKPLVPYPGSARNWKCECLKCGETVFPNYGDIKQGDGGCKYCAKHFVKPEDAESLMRFNNLEPLEPYKNTMTPWKCKCMKCGKLVTPRYNSVQKRGGGCKYCAKRFVDAEDAILMMKAAKFEPLTPYPGANKPWKCKCLRCGREVQPAYTTIQNGQKGCVYCGGKKVDPQEAFDFMVSKGLQPLEPYKKADGKWKCRCVICQKEVTPTYSTLRQGANGCIYCSGRKVDPQDAVTLFLENSLKPLVPYVSTETKWKSECMKCKRVVYPTHHMVAQRSGGCKYCSTLGMDFTLPAYIYLITHELYGAHKIGISGMHSKEDRLKDHAKNGWTLYKKRTFESADQTYDIEQGVLLWLREERGLPPFLSLSEMPQRGWTETVDGSEIDLPTIWAKVEELSKVEK
jgi:recombinational DNA repair protein (RecF pathway)